MSTTLKPELSQNNPYHITRHRFYELKHFCLQYPYWKKQYVVLAGFIERPGLYSKVNTGSTSDVTAHIAEQMAHFSTCIDLVESTAQKTDPVIGSYILTGVTEGLSYDVLKAKLEIPCCRDSYYHLYRRFFALLDQARG